jgi:hypothetical protein
MNTKQKTKTDQESKLERILIFIYKPFTKKVYNLLSTTIEQDGENPKNYLMDVICKKFNITDKEGMFYWIENSESFIVGSFITDTKEKEKFEDLAEKLIKKGGNNFDQCYMNLAINIISNGGTHIICTGRE